MKVAAVPIPKRLAGLPRDPRGFPIPWIVWHDANGVPDFRVNDYTKFVQLATHRLCGLCGQHISGEYVFIGGPKCVAARQYIDAPSHEECARYARKVCPFLATGRTYIRDRTRPLQPDDILIDIEVDEKPEEFVMYWTRSYTLSRDYKGECRFLVGPPTRQERWRL